MNRRRASAAPALDASHLDHLESVRHGANTKKRLSIDAFTAKLKSKFCHGSTPTLNSIETEEDCTCSQSRFDTPLSRDYGAPSPLDGFDSPSLYRNVVSGHPKKEKRSQSLTVSALEFRASSTTALTETDESRFRNPRKDSKEYHRRRSVQQFQALQSPPYMPRQDLERDLLTQEMQMRIYRAKAEAKTVSVRNGCLYINYEYIGPLPDGCVI